MPLAVTPCKLASPAIVVTAAILGGIALAVSTCQGAVIDLFSEAPQRLSLPRSLRHDPNWQPVRLHSSLFDYRRLDLEYGTQFMSVVPGEGMHYQVEPDSRFAGYFQIQYTSDKPVDVLQDGATAMRLMFDTAQTGSNFPLRLEINGDLAYQIQLRDHFWANPGRSSVTIPYSDLWIDDLSNVRSFTFDSYRLAPGTSFRLLSITTIPEPATPVLGFLALFLFASRRRRCVSTRATNASSHPRPPR